MTDQHVGARRLGQDAVGLNEHVVADDRHVPSARHARNVGPGILMLDLQVVADGIDNQVSLDQSGHERRASVRVAQVHSGTGADDRVAADDPVPGRALGRNPIRLLIVAVPADDEVLQRDVMRRARLLLRFDGVDRQVVPLQHEVDILSVQAIRRPGPGRVSPDVERRAWFSRHSF